MMLLQQVDIKCKFFFLSFSLSLRLSLSLSLARSLSSFAISNHGIVISLR